METHLLAFAMNYTRNKEDAQDLTQETMLKAIRYKEQYIPQTNFKAWVFTIMKNTFINQYRRRVKSRTIFDNSTDYYLLNNTSVSTSSPLHQLTNQEVIKKIDQLENEYKVPFEMHFAGYKYKEISDKLDIPLGTVKSRIFIARKKLMEAMPEYQFSEN